MGSTPPPSDEEVVQRALQAAFGAPGDPEFLARGEAVVRAAALERVDAPLAPVISLAERRRRLALRITSGAAAAVIGLSVTGVAAARTGPDQFLYPVKGLTEQVRDLVTLDGVASARLQLGFAETRLDELVALDERAETATVTDLQRRFDGHLRRAVELGGEEVAGEVADLRRRGRVLFEDALEAEEPPPDRAPVDDPVGPTPSEQATPRDRPSTAPNDDSAVEPTDRAVDDDGGARGTGRGDVPAAPPPAPPAPPPPASDPEVQDEPDSATPDAEESEETQPDDDADDTEAADDADDAEAAIVDHTEDDEVDGSLAEVEAEVREDREVDEQDADIEAGDASEQHVDADDG